MPSTVRRASGHVAECHVPGHVSVIQGVRMPKRVVLHIAGGRHEADVGLVLWFGAPGGEVLARVW